ncbi:MAG: DUF5916 domain-containing protein [bacterium]|jgi:hypothetical protein
MLKRSRFFVTAALLAIVMGAATGTVAQEPASDDTVKAIVALHCNCGIKIDGVIDEDVWQLAPRSGGFVQYEPDEGKPASESTFVRVAFDDEALFVAFECFDSEPDKIIKRLTRRDRYIEGDLVNLIIDSHHDHQTAYAFVLYASGTQRDVYYYNDNWSNDNWDAVWEGRAKVHDWGWVAEFKIPFHCLRYSCEKDPVWGIYFSRRISRKSELDRWLFIPSSTSGFVSHFGHLQGLCDLKRSNRVEVLPYAVSYAETESRHAGNPDGRDYSGNMGFDLKYGLSSALTLDATVNPDFGQVEQDETVLNLSTFETWYPEKRPFFLEGAQIFETYYDLFYSRRIGRPPSIWPEDVDYYTDRPMATTILGAGKVTGKTSGGTSIGLLASMTQREHADYVDTLGSDRQEVIEPRASFLVARIKQDVLENSEIGAMATAVNQNTLDPAYTGGVDWRIRFLDGDYLTDGHVVASSTAPDESGHGAMLGLEKSGGEHWRGSIRGDYRSRELDLNRMGFLGRPDYLYSWLWVQYRTNEPWWFTRRMWHNINVGYANNLDGVPLTRGGNYNNYIELKNYWYIGMGTWQDYAKQYSDRETRGGPPAPIPIGQNAWFSVETDARKPYMGVLELSGGDTMDGTYYAVGTYLELRPRSNIQVSAGPSFRSDWGSSRWVKNTENEAGERDKEIFGELASKRLDMTIRGTVNFTRDISLQIYAQPFMASVDYSNFKVLVPPDDFEYVGKDIYDEEVEEPDYTWASFNSNMVLRWEYRPGSTLFFVWAHTRDTTTGYGNFDLGRDWDNLFASAATNTFLIKLNYWLTL